jgi:hypothetical protein
VRSEAAIPVWEFRARRPFPRTSQLWLRHSIRVHPAADCLRGCELRHGISLVDYGDSHAVASQFSAIQPVVCSWAPMEILKWLDAGPTACMNASFFESFIERPAEVAIRFIPLARTFFRSREGSVDENDWGIRRWSTGAHGVYATNKRSHTHIKVGKAAGDLLPIPKLIRNGKSLVFIGNVAAGEG